MLVDLRRTLVLLSCAIAALSCRPADDQTLASPELLALVNPAPPADALETSRRHQVLIAIIDSGVDYLHPLLRERIHFSPGPAGSPPVSGYDFLGNDPWPFPLILRTAEIDPGAKPQEREEAARARIALTRTLSSESPELASSLHPSRDLLLESAVAAHGTHVAGLAAYDDERIGILPYRVLPGAARGPGQNTLRSILGAIEHARASGARVVNLSLGLAAAVKMNSAWLTPRVKLIEEAVRAMPEIVFVAAAGNEADWIDGKARGSYPCGVPAPNVLCVASVNEAQEISAFTTLPLIDSPVVFARGENLLSTVPTQVCDGEATLHLKQIEDSSPSDEPQARDQARLLAGVLRQHCRKPANALGLMTGTSMATPIVARLIAQQILRDPARSGAQVVQDLLQAAQVRQLGPFEMRVLSAPLPSWYPRSSGSSLRSLRAQGLPADSFELFVPNGRGVEHRAGKATR